MRAKVQALLGRSTARGQRVATIVIGTVVDRGARRGGGLVRQPAPSGRGRISGAHVGDKLPAAHEGAKADVRTEKLDAFKLEKGGLADCSPRRRSRPRLAPQRRSSRSSSRCPIRQGGFQRFALSQSDIMAPGLAAKHPEIATYQRSRASTTRPRRSTPT